MQSKEKGLFPLLLLMMMVILVICALRYAILYRLKMTSSTDDPKVTDDCTTPDALKSKVTAQPLLDLAQKRETMIERTKRLEL